MSSGLYGTDLSYIHDAGFGDHSIQAGKHIVRLLKKHRIKKGLVVDLGCGSGLWAEQLHRGGFDVHGIDMSPAMIFLAKKRVPQGRFFIGSLYRARIPHCRAITSLGECFNYRSDGKISDTRLLKLFRHCFNALTLGGLFVFDILIWKNDVYIPYKKFTQQKNWAVLVEVTINRRSRELTRTITSFRKHGSIFRRTDETHTVQLFDRRKVAVLLREAGFHVHILDSYGSMKLRPGHIAFVAQKIGEMS